MDDVADQTLLTYIRGQIAEPVFDAPARRFVTGAHCLP